MVASLETRWQCQSCMLSEGAVPRSNLVCTSRSGIMPWPQEALLKLPALVNAPIIFCFSGPAWHVDIPKAAFILPVCQHILLTVTNPFTSSFTAPPLSASTAIFAGSKLVFSLPDHGENSSIPGLRAELSPNSAKLPVPSRGRHWWPSPLHRCQDVKVSPPVPYVLVACLAGLQDMLGKGFELWA